MKYEIQMLSPCAVEGPPLAHMNTWSCLLLSEATGPSRLGLCTLPGSGEVLPISGHPLRWRSQGLDQQMLRHRATASPHAKGGGLRMKGDPQNQRYPPPPPFLTGPNWYATRNRPRPPPPLRLEALGKYVRRVLLASFLSSESCLRPALLRARTRFLGPS